MIIADTKADTKRYDSDAFLDSVALEIIGNSSRVGWSGRPFTPATPIVIFQFTTNNLIYGRSLEELMYNRKTMLNPQWDFIAICAKLFCGELVEMKNKVQISERFVFEITECLPNGF